MLENIPRPRGNSRRGIPRIPLTATGIAVLGFGYYRAYRSEPWFKRADLEQAAVDAKVLGLNENGEVKIPPRWYYGEYLKQYVELGLLNARANKPGELGPSLRKYVSLSCAGADLLMQSASYSLRYQGETVPGLFKLPQVADAIRLDGKLLTYTVATMEGEPVRATLMPEVTSAEMTS